MTPGYRGRFAPSPTGPLHAGSLVAALASWLDARAHGGRWLVRIEDVDLPRCGPGTDHLILSQLAAFGLVPDEPVVWQSQRGALYQQALDRLVAAGLAYPCGCTRREIEAEWTRRGKPHQRHGELIYPGTCRNGLQGHPAGAWRLRTNICKPNSTQPIVGRSLYAIDSEVILNATETFAAPPVSPDRVGWHDRRLGSMRQDVQAEVGDFVLRRADGLWAYQLAVVVDDAAQGITHIVRGEDLADNTPRQLLLQRALGLPAPVYLHTPLVRAADGEKLSKQNDAAALDASRPLAALTQAGAVLGLHPQADNRADWLAGAVAVWRACWPVA